MTEASPSPAPELHAPSAGDTVRLRSAGFLAPFGREPLAALLAEARVLVAPPFHTVFRQNDEAEAVWVVIEGTVGQVAEIGPGETCLVELIGPGQALGEAGLFDTGRYAVTARAITEARLARIPAAPILARLEVEPALRRHMLGFLSARLHSLVRQIALLKLMSAAQRVAGFLLGLCGPRPGSQTLHLACERRIIAGLLGMTPESLSRSLAQLRKLGVRSQGKRDIVVEDPERLRSFVTEG